MKYRLLCEHFITQCYATEWWLVTSFFRSSFNCCQHLFLDPHSIVVNNEHIQLRLKFFITASKK